LIVYSRTLCRTTIDAHPETSALTPSAVRCEMICPNCGLRATDRARRCACGYDLMTGEMGASEPWFVLDSTLKPLRFIFWGSLLLPFDFELFLGSFRVDLLNDAVGLGLVSAGIYQLEHRRLPGANRFAMRLVLVLALLATLVTTSRQLGLRFSGLPYMETASNHLLLGAAILFSRNLRGWRATSSSQTPRCCGTSSPSCSSWASGLLSPSYTRLREVRP